MAAATDSAALLTGGYGFLLRFVVLHATAAAIALVFGAVGTAGDRLFAIFAVVLGFREDEAVAFSAIDSCFDQFAGLRMWNHCAVRCHSVALLAVVANSHGLVAARTCTHGAGWGGLATGQD